jgi:hypothetical protein
MVEKSAGLDGNPPRYYLPSKCSTKRIKENFRAKTPRRKEKYLLISLNLACFASLRE